MSAVLTGVVGEPERQQGGCSVESVEKVIISADRVSPGARCCSQVESLEAGQSCPGVAASGYSFTRAPGTSRGHVGLSSGTLSCSLRDRLADETKQESKQGDRQIGRCCRGQTHCVVLGS